MRLNHSTFPIVMTSEEVIAQVKELLEEKEWDDYEINHPELWFFPYWFFGYHSFVETADESGAVSTSEGETGVTAMNGQTAEIEDELGPLLDEFESQLVLRPDESHTKVVRFRINGREAERLSQLKIAAKYNLGKESIVISGLRPLYVPVWLCDASIEGRQLEFQFSAVNSELVSETDVPYRSKTGHELVGETVSDLRNPGNWIRYLVDIIKGILGFLWDNPASKWFREKLGTDNRFRIAVLGLIVLILILAQAGVLHIPYLTPVKWTPQS
ncbi:MAG: hypothetical protein V1777_02800 [Candidatus Micrarchaeota archaeon]